MSITPTDNDVLFGRGYTIKSHPGNQLLRSMVQAQKQNFIQCKKLEKRQIACNIVEDIYNLGGRFLIFDYPKGARTNSALVITEKTWVCAHTEKAVEKVMHRLRENRDGSSKNDTSQNSQAQGNKDTHPSSLQEVAVIEDDDRSPRLDSQTLLGNNNINQSSLQQVTITEDYSGSPGLTVISSRNSNMQQTEDILPIGVGGTVEFESFADNTKGNFSQLHLNSVADIQHDANQSLGLKAKQPFFYCLDNAKNSVKSFPLLVADFLKSDRSSNRILYLHREHKQASIQSSDDPNHQGKQITENAAKLALLFTRAFFDLLLEADLGSIKLDDFWINLEQDLSDNYTLKAGNIIPSMHGTKQALDSCRNDSFSRPTFLLLRIIYFPPTRAIGPQAQPESKAVQILSHFLYSVFSQGEPLPSDLLTTKTLVSQESTASSYGRPCKPFRSAGRTVFSKLVENNSFPVSICRLISDMVDSGPDDWARHPLRSCDDIIQDLEQMINQPKTFLHDSRLALGVPVRPLFGQTCHGRENEIADLGRIVIQIEQTLHEANPKSLNLGCLDAIFVSGIAGSGKSYLVQAVEDLLSPRWTVIKAKFERDKEYASRRVVSSMFDQLIMNLVTMKESGRLVDATYSQQVSKSILETLGYDTLSSLMYFLPSLSSLFDGLHGNDTRQMQTEDHEFRLVFSISKIIEAMLESDRLIMICCDDLQWADKTSLSLISEVLVNVGSFKHVCSRCLFFGLFRHDEIDDNHPFTLQYSYLQMMTSNINITKIELSSLTKTDICDMLMADLGLPRRFVVQLAAAVHKKTAGHAFFVVEFLNSLLRSSIIAYSLQERRYTWDQDTIEIVQPDDGVAGLIASNLKCLPPTSQRVLQILSCFGIQTDISLLEHLENFQEGIICSLHTYVQMGILDRAGPILIFTHDLIQQGAYEMNSLAERQLLHLQIGQFLGERANIDDSSSNNPLTSGLAQLQLDDREGNSGKTMASSLISLACDQIDSVGLDVIRNEGQRVAFANWNLSAGKEAYRESNPQTALYYFSKGINFLGQEYWHMKDYKLCRALHKGAVMASFTLGKPESVSRYAGVFISNVKFEDSLEIQPIVLSSLSQTGNHKECISKGLEILRCLNFDIPLAPTPESLINAITTTDTMTSKVSMDQLLNLCEKAVDVSVHPVVGIIDAIFASCYATSSPVMPLVACTTIQFSLQHGIYPESISAFAIFGMLKIFNEGDYLEARYWADAVTAFVQRHKTTNFRAQMLMYLAVDIWFMSPRTIAEKLLCNHQNATRKGFIDAAMISLQTGWRFKLLGGEQLSLVYKSSQERLRLMTKHSPYAAKCALLDNILLMELTGKSGDYFSAFEGSICNMNGLQDVAKSSKDLHLLQSSHVFSVLVNYWRGNYTAAEHSSHLASTILPASRMPTIYLIYHTFFRGLILFHLYQTHGDEERLKHGKEMMEKMGEWALLSMSIFENKMLLLKAEYFSCINSFGQALEMYEGSIKSAQDHGNIHELALAHELLGKQYSERGIILVSNECLKKAHAYYTQWGATAIAEKILLDHHLETDSFSGLQNQKHSRQWD